MSRTDDAMWAHNRYILGKQVFSLIFNAWLKIIGNNMNKKSSKKWKKLKKIYLSVPSNTNRALLI